MNKHVLWLLWILLALGIPAHAQGEDTGAYRLRVPSAKEYMDEIPKIIAQTEQERCGSCGKLVSIILREMEKSYLNLSSLPFHTLYNAYRVLNPDNPLSPNSDMWPNWLVAAWLRDNQIDLNDVTRLQFEDYTIGVTPTDFNGDSIPEWVLNITSPTYNALWVMAREKADSSIYYRIDTTPPLSFFSGCSTHLSCGGGAEQIGIEDVNSDGVPEWLVSVGSCGYGICGVRLRIMSWRDNAMVDLTENNPASIPRLDFPAVGGGVRTTPPNHAWTFTNVDSDPAKELIQNDTYYDNRECLITETRIFDWNSAEDVYMGGEGTRAYADSVGCALRLAHIAMMNGEYGAAITNYEKVLALLQTNEDAYEREVRQYSQIRLAAAYALNGRSDEAIEQLIHVATQSPASSLMGELITSSSQAYMDSQNPVALCAALYHVIENYDYWGDEESAIIAFGQINDRNITMNYGGGDYGPAATGCNLPELFDELIATTAFGTNTPIVTQITENGWSVDFQFHADLNQDGQDEWLLWLNGLEYALLLVPDGDQYKGSKENVLPPGQYAEFSTWPLPDNVGTALARLSYGEISSYDLGECPDSQQKGKIDMRRLDGSNLRRVGGTTLCERLKLSEILLPTNELRGWEWDGSQMQFVETTYIWNAETLTFDEFGQEEMSQELSPNNDYFSCGFENEEFCGYFAEDIEALAIINSALADYAGEQVDTYFLTGVHYLKATILENLARPDEALAEYIAVYEAAPESAWGMLATLHLEAMDSE